MCITPSSCSRTAQLSPVPQLPCKYQLCCSLRVAASAGGRPGCSCSSCSHGHRVFVTLAPVPSPDCLADLPGSFCTAAQKPDFPVLHPQCFIHGSSLTSGTLPLPPESHLTLPRAQPLPSAHLNHAQAYHSVFGMAPPSMGQGLLPQK